MSSIDPKSQKENLTQTPKFAIHSYGERHLVSVQADSEQNPVGYYGTGRACPAARIASNAPNIYRCCENLENAESTHRGWAAWLAGA